jgi:hypothetical protein
MSDLVIPSALDIARIQFRYVDSSAATRGIFNGITKTTSYGGDRVAADIEFSQAGGGSTTGRSRRAQLKAFLMALRGRQNRVYVADASSALRGSFEATERFTNSDFSNGTTGWTGSFANLTVADGVLRATVSQGGATVNITQAVALTAFVPHVLRSIVSDGAQTAGISVGPALQYGASAFETSYSTTRGYRLAAAVAMDATSRSQYPMNINASSGFSAGAHVGVSFVSLSRCLLTASASNAFDRSDEFDHANWTKNAVTIQANTRTSPFGDSGGDRVVETTANSTHTVDRSTTKAAAAEDWCYAVALKSGDGSTVRDFTALIIDDGAGTNQVRAVFNTTAGTFANVISGGTFTNARAFMAPLGNGWHYCCLIGTTSTGTTVRARIAMSSNSTPTLTYTGDTNANIAAFRATLAKSSTPIRLVASTSAAVVTSSQNAAAGIYVKGGRGPSEGALLGALLAETWVEIDGQVCMVTAPLDLDAAGLGFLHLSPPPRRALPDNTPIIVHKPMGRFIYAGDSVGWDNEPGSVSRAILELEEAFA